MVVDINGMKYPICKERLGIAIRVNRNIEAELIKKGRSDLFHPLSDAQVQDVIEEWEKIRKKK